MSVCKKRPDNLVQGDIIVTDKGQYYTVRGAWTNDTGDISIQFYDRNKHDYRAGKGIKLAFNMEVSTIAKTDIP